ncbi:MAG: Na+/H+ antiporter subunit A [Dehalobacterium sp.]
MNIIHLIIFIPLIAAFFVPLFYKQFSKIHTGWFVLPIPALLFARLVTEVPVVSEGGSFMHTLTWIPSLDINLTVCLDGLSLLFGLIILGVGTLVVLYSIYYLDKEREALGNFYLYLLIFMGAMLGLVFSDHLMLLYAFWELTSVSSFLLIAYWYQRKNSRAGAQKALFITIFGGLCMLTGFILLSSGMETYSIREIIGSGKDATQMPLFLPAMVLILLGSFTKSAQFPFHIWLPDAMEAPTPISAYLHSATMVKAGIYLVARLTPIFGGIMLWFWLVSLVGLITLFWGSFSAVKQTDLKAMLAFSTVSQLGMIMCLLGLGSVALAEPYNIESSLYPAAMLTAIFHLVNHSTFKGCLFMIVGIIDHNTGTRDIRKLGGLIRIMPVSFTMMMIGGFSMAGLPPFSGFLSKELFFTSVLHIARLDIFQLETWGLIFPVVAWIASIFTFVYCMILIFKTFFGKYQPQKLEKEAYEGSWKMLIPPLMLASLTILFFFYPNILAEYLLLPALAAVLPNMAAMGFGIEPILAWHGWTTELLMTLGVVILGVFLYLTFSRWSRIYYQLPAWLTLNHGYERFLVLIEKVSKTITNTYMTGFTRDYLSYIFLFVILLIGSSLFVHGNISFDFSDNSPIAIYEVILVLVLIGAALTVALAYNRLASIIALGVMGYVVAMFFVVFRAPDLALTQLVVETVTTTLFLLCFYHLPKLKKEVSRLSFKVTNLLISLGVGLIFTVMALSAQGHQLFPPISDFFENSYELAGANNMVNALLVDFRGFDTMLEITVFTIAGIGVYTLIKLRMSGRDSD